MKKMLIATLATGLISSVFADNVVSSANVVGYAKLALASNDYTLVSTAFTSEENTVAGLFPDLPSGSQVMFWDDASQSYISSSLGRGGWSNNASTNVIENGSGVFIQLPAGYDDVEIIISGDVPTVDTQMLSKNEGLTLLSYPYPAEIAFTNTQLAATSISGDTISFWDNGWKSFTKGRGGWDAGVEEITLKLGQAFFYQSSTAASVEEDKPYSLD